MSFRRIIIVVTGCLLSTLLIADGLVGQQSWSHKSGINADEIDRLLGQLESDSYVQRNAATQKLADAGVIAVQQVVERLLNGPPETAARCSRLLSQIAMEAEEQDMTRIARILLLLSDNGLRHLRDESLILNSRWKQARIERTVKRLADAGIQATPVGSPQFGVGGGLRVIRAIDSIDVEQQSSEPNTENNSIDAESGKPRLEVDEILVRVDEIIATSEDENNKRFSDEILSQTNTDNANTAGQASGLGTDVVIMGGEARIIMRGDGGLVTIDGHPIDSDGVSTPYYVTVDKGFSGTNEDLKLLGLLPSIAQLTISERKIDETMLRLLKNPAIRIVSLNSCDYDLEKLFAVLKERPDLSVSATGHNSFLGVQLQTDQSANGSYVCRVLEVVQDTAAEDAGVRANDIIRTINDVSVSSYEQVILAIGAFKPGDVLELDILRGQEELMIEAKLRERPAGQ